MPYIKCPYCAYRIVQPTVVNVCPNCGQFLSEANSVGASSSTSGRASSMSMQPVSPSRDEAPADEEDIFTIPAFAPEDSVVQPGRKGRFKRSTRPADLQGIVVGIQTQNDVKRPPDIVGGFFRTIRDILWPVVETHQQNTDDKTVVTQIRLRTANMTQRDARLAGTLTGASISLGDQLSLWGRYRNGTLVVQRAYNHTSEADITAGTASASLLLPLISLIVLLVAVYLLVVRFHQFWPWH